jgi:hypothetical protein
MSATVRRATVERTGENAYTCSLELTCDGLDTYGFVEWLRARYKHEARVLVRRPCVVVSVKTYEPEQGEQK